MARLETVTAPLVIRFSDGSEKVVSRAFPHPEGVVYLDLFWHLKSPVEAAHLLPGELSGEGPWRVGDVVIRVLGCANTDPHLQAQFLPWKEYLEQNGEAYPPEAQIHEIAAKLGCILESGES
ncbi:MAG: hypothetical protein DSZ00_07295 [Gammaproteobacteria bacterium]|nr:MAG: hypothetical protein DSZ00_07295 [Gammaproteobacteria bacterium]RTZ78819.1 MAG: hypothetical protein DSZ01_04795 [Gammaproteobacteria bacterium]